MPIKNKGNYKLSDVVKLQIANDWPTAQVTYTSDVIESASNLYFTNARVNATVQPFLTTANVIETSGNLYFTTARVNATVQPFLTTANVIETSGNLYFTTARGRTAFTAGKGIAVSANGVITSKGDDTGLGTFNSGINLANALLVSNTFANLITFQSDDGVSFIVYSLHLTNYSNQTAYVTSRYVSGANTIFIANLMEMPGPSFVEMQIKPQIYKVGDQLQFQSFSSPTQPANNLVSAIISYQGSTDVNFDRTANILTNNNPANIFTTTSRTSIIESIKIANPNPTNVPVSVWLADKNYNLFAYIAANVVVPSFSSIELCDYPKAMRDDFTLRAQKFGAVNDKISVFVSSKYTSQYIVTPSTESVDEGSTVTFDVDTLNVGDGTTLYYTLSFYSNSLFANDFVSNVSGSTIVTNDRALIPITINADNNSFQENDETFRLQLRKTSISGPILVESANIIIKNTSNVQTLTVNNISSTAPNVILENTNAIISINTTNYGNNITLYYSTTGNVISSDFVQGNTGTVLITDNAANLTLTAGSLASGTKSFVLELRRDSVTGTPLYVSSNILIVDSALAFTSATGGIQANVTENGKDYRLHIFTSSGTFTVNRVGAVSPEFEYISVAGGGGSAPTVSGVGGGGGGGAGGMLFGNTTLSATSYVMSIGGGGYGGGFYPGGNTGIFSNVLISIGGGGGGGATNGIPGGSGGGSSIGTGGGTPTIGGAGWGYPGTPGVTQQGYPGGNSSGTGYGGLAGGGGAAGAGGNSNGTTGVNGAGGAGVGVSWVPASYGTPGPSPALRYFSKGGAGSSTPVEGAVNTGGGGAGNNQAGGSGIAIVRYRTA